MATQIKISELPLASESALSLAADDRFIFNNDNVNTQTIKFSNLVDAICEQNLTFTGNCQFTQKIVGPDGGDIQVGLDDLVDVQFQNVTSGQVMTYSGTQWINRDVKDVALQLDSLSVVVSDTPSGGGNLTYDNATGEFTFTPAVEGSFTPSSISVVTSSAASGGGALAYNPSNSVFTFTPADAYTKSESYNKNEVDTFLAGKANVADVYSIGAVDTALATKASNVLLGVANGATNLGAFTGSTINANQNVKQVIQQLETAIEAIDTSNLVDSGSLATVATTGSYTDLLNIPALGTAASKNDEFFASAEQGLRADSALQPAAVGTTVQGYDPNTVVDANYATVQSGAAAGATALQPSAIGTTVQGYDANTVVDANYATVQSGAAAGATAVQASANAITVTNLPTDGTATVDTLAAAINTLTGELAAILNA